MHCNQKQSEGRDVVMSSFQQSLPARRYGEALAMLLTLLLLGACGTNVPNLPAGPDAPIITPTYMIQPGDQLDVKFVKNPELNEQPFVQPDGRISMLFAPNLEVGGLSTEQARQALAESYSKELKEPGISVTLKGAVTWRIYVAGEVKTPGEIDGTGPVPSLIQAVAHAGGMLDSGDPTKVVLVRRENGNQKKAYLVNYDAAARGEKPADDTQLAAYDVLFIPRTGVADVYSAYNQYFKQFLPPNIGFGFGTSL
jgi:polysaccharide export outer membrane protein